MKIIDLLSVNAVVRDLFLLLIVSTGLKGPEHKAEQDKISHLLLIVTRINQE